MLLGMNYKRVRIRPFIVLMVIVSVAVICMKRLEPSFLTQIDGNSDYIINNIVNTAIKETLSEEKYNKFESIEYNNQNMSVTANTSLINSLKSDLILKINEDMKQTDAITVKLPLFSILNIHILSGMGPKIPIHVSPTAIVNSQFEESFDNVGINNIKYTLRLNISANMTYSGYMFTHTRQTDTEAIILETVITGDIPEYYGANVGFIGD